MIYASLRDLNLIMFLVESQQDRSNLSLVERLFRTRGSMVKINLLVESSLPNAVQETGIVGFFRIKNPRI